MFHGQIPGICVSWNQQTVIPTHLWLQKLINHISLRATLIVNSLLLLVLLLLLLLLLLPLAESHGWRNRGTGRLSPACRRAQRGPAGLRAERRRPQMPWATGPKWSLEGHLSLNMSRTNIWRFIVVLSVELFQLQTISMPVRWFSRFLDNYHLAGPLVLISFQILELCWAICWALGESRGYSAGTTQGLACFYVFIKGLNLHAGTPGTPGDLHHSSFLSRISMEWRLPKR
jgi:hypothetical protein